jgi:hypothetical protein
VVQLFLVAYLVALGVTTFLTGQKAWGYAVVLGLGFMGFFAVGPLFVVAAVLTYTCAVLGLRSALAGFPWPDVPQFQQFQSMKQAKSNAQFKDRGSLGWPFARLGPMVCGPVRFRLGDSILGGLLTGWLFFVAAYQMRPRASDNELLWTLCLFILVYGIIGRVALYCNGYAPPIGLWGRIALGRFIIPGYDQVLVAPVLAILSFAAARFLPVWSGMPEYFGPPIAVTAVWWSLVCVGPGLEAWRLTGNHRIVKGLVSSKAR